MGAVAILFGGMSALDDKQEAQVQNDIEQVQQIDDDTLQRFGVDVDALWNPIGIHRNPMKSLEIFRIQILRSPCKSLQLIRKLCKSLQVLRHP